MEKLPAPHGPILVLTAGPWQPCSHKLSPSSYLSSILTEALDGGERVEVTSSHRSPLGSTSEVPSAPNDHLILPAQKLCGRYF